MRTDHALYLSRERLRVPGLYLILVTVLLAVLFSLTERTMLDFRAGHMDEYDYLFVGKTLLNDQRWPTYTYIFGSNFNWYLFGFADQWIGGLTGARALAAVLGIISLAATYALGLILWKSHQMAVCGVLLLAVNSSHIFVSKIATYDSVGFALFTTALACLAFGRTHNDTSEWQSYTCIGAGALLILLAVLSKYMTAAYLPLIIFFLFLASARLAAFFTMIVATGLAIHVHMHWDSLAVLYDIQIRGAHGPNATYSNIAIRILNHTGLLFAPAIYALFHARSTTVIYGKRPRTVIALLLLLSLPMFFYHLQGRNLISLYKHMVYANLFLSLATAWLIVTMANLWITSGKHGRLHLLTAFLILYSSVNFYQLRDIQRGYPDHSNLLTFIESNNIDGTIISEDPYLFRYLKFDQMPQEHISETTWFDNNLDGKHTPKDVVNAIWDRKFEYVLLTDAIHPTRNDELRNILEMRGYHLEFNQSYTLSSVMTANTAGDVSLYKRPPHPSLSQSSQP